MNGSQGTKHMIGQINDLLCQLDDTAYAKPISLFKGGTLGQHFRHILDFYNCLVAGALLGELDYSKRARNPLMETKIEVAKDSFNAILDKLSQFSEEQRVKVVTDFSIDENGVRSVVISSVGRELMYAYDHAIHHLAIIRMGIQTAFPEVELCESLGVAPSTVKHSKQSQRSG